MLVQQHGTSAPVVEEVGVHHVVEEQHELRPRDERRAEPTSVDVARFAHTSSGMRVTLHSGRAHRQDRDEEVDRREDRGKSGELHADVEEQLRDRLVVGGERRIRRPAGAEALPEEARDHHHAARREHPEAERVQPRERHVVGAEHQRDHEVREPGEHRDDEQEDHQRRMHRDQPVVLVHREELQPGFASSVRNASAHSPPIRKNANVVTRYWIPITL